MSSPMLTAIHAAVLILCTAPDISGNWDLTLKADWTSIPALSCTLSQDGQKVTGSCRAAGEPADRAVQLTDSRIDGDRVQFGWQIMTPDGEKWVYTLNGTVDEKAGAMKGSFKVSSRVGGGDGTFTAKKRAK